MEIVQEQPEKLRISYQEIHSLVKNGATKLQELEFKPDYIIAIGGGGFIPARILRTYVEVPILALTISFYEGESHTVSSKPKIVQNLDPEMIRRKKILIVDEVDDTRSTLNWIVKNIIATVTEDYGIFVVHNKNKDKVVKIEDIVNDSNLYISCSDTNDIWIEYPWDHF